jgi:hypothetical protein
MADDTCSSCSRPSTTAADLDAKLAALDVERVNTVRPFTATTTSVSGPIGGRCLSAPTTRLNAQLRGSTITSPRVAGVMSSFDGFGVDEAPADFHGGTSVDDGYVAPSKAFITAVPHPPSRPHDANTTPRRPTAPPTARPVTARALKAFSVGSPQPQPASTDATPPSTSRRRATIGAIASSANADDAPRSPRYALAPTTRVALKLQQYRDDSDEMQLLQLRLAQYRHEEQQAKRLGVPLRTVRQKAPTVLGNTMRDAAANAAAADPDVNARDLLEPERCAAWFQRRLAARPTVELRPTPEEIKRHNAEREELHKQKALEAAAEVRWRKEQATSDARRAALRSKEAAEVAKQIELQRAIQWLTAVTLATQMRRVWMRNVALAMLAARARYVVRLRERAFRVWLEPAIAARNLLKRRGDRARWFYAIAAVRLLARLRRRRALVGRIVSYLSAVRNLGRMCIAVRQYHRRIVACQRAVRGYLDTRLWRLQLLHLQWDLAEAAILAQRRGEMSPADVRLAREASVGSYSGGTKGGGKLTSAKAPSPKASQQSDAHEKQSQNRKLGKKARATQLITTLSDDEKVKLVVDNDVKSGGLHRPTPFLLRHRAILKYWMQARRAHLRRVADWEKAIAGIVDTPNTSPVREGLRRTVSRSAVAVLQRSSSFRSGHASAKDGASPAVIDLDAALRSSRTPAAAASPLDVSGLSPVASVTFRPLALQPGQPPPRKPRMTMLMPPERLHRVMLHALEEYMGLCREKCLVAGRAVVVGKMSAEDYAIQRDSLIDAMFSTSKAEEQGFHQASLVRSGCRILAEYNATVAPRRSALGSAISLAKANPQGSTSPSRQPRSR